MAYLSLPASYPPISFFQKIATNSNRHFLTINDEIRPSQPQPKLNTIVHCSARSEEQQEEYPPLSTSSAAYAVLGVSPGCSVAEIKSAFRSKVKQFHPDVNGGSVDSDKMIRHVIRAYQILSDSNGFEIVESECLDPFDEPESETLDVFVNEVICIGKGCPDSCVERAPHAFSYVSSTGKARATSQGHGDDYQVQLAVGLCPRSCIYYVTPSQRAILEESLDGVEPINCSNAADLLYSLWRI